VEPQLDLSLFAQKKSGIAGGDFESGSFVEGAEVVFILEEFRELENQDAPVTQGHYLEKVAEGRLFGLHNNEFFVDAVCPEAAAALFVFLADAELGVHRLAALKVVLHSESGAEGCGAFVGGHGFVIHLMQEVEDNQLGLEFGVVLTGEQEIMVVEALLLLLASAEAAVIGPPFLGVREDAVGFEEEAHADFARAEFARSKGPPARSREIWMELLCLLSEGAFYFVSAGLGFDAQKLIMGLHRDQPRSTGAPRPAALADSGLATSSASFTHMPSASIAAISFESEVWGLRPDLRRRA